MEGHQLVPRPHVQAGGENEGEAQQGGVTQAREVDPSSRSHSIPKMQSPLDCATRSLRGDQSTALQARAACVRRAMPECNCRNLLWTKLLLSALLLAAWRHPAGSAGVTGRRVASTTGPPPLPPPRLGRRSRSWPRTRRPCGLARRPCGTTPRPPPRPWARPRRP